MLILIIMGSFKSAKIYKEGELWAVKITFTDWFYEFPKTPPKIHEFETYELALTFLARERCKGEVELPVYVNKNKDSDSE